MKRWISLGLAALVALGASRSSYACGGFFCSRSPIVQSGEKILFAVGDTGIEVHVQISYQGADADFAWIVPVRQVPTLSVGSDQLFTALDAATVPTFLPNIHYPTGCGDVAPESGFGGSDLGAFSAGDMGAGSVNVISQQSVGPYDSVILQSNDPKALLNWLLANHYNLTPQSQTLIEPYVLEHDYFVALRLNASSTSSDIRPIVLRFAGTEPCVPLRLTAVAALDNMAVTAFLLGPSRAVPTNYYEVRINELRIDWLRGGYNYPMLVAEAALEAGGNAFVTEYAGASNILRRPYWLDQIDLAGLRAQTDPVAYWSKLIASGIPGDSTLLEILRRWIPEPASLAQSGVSEKQFYNDLRQYSASLMGFVFDPIGMTNDLDIKILQLLDAGFALFKQHPYLTRVFTAISPAQMTKDPTFAFNPTLADVSNVHTADVYLGCNYDSPVRLVLANGEAVIIDRTVQGQMQIDALPAAQSWWQLGPTGPGILVQSRDREIGDYLAQHFYAVGGCHATPGSSSNASLISAIAVLLASVFGFAWRTRRRRRATDG